MVAIMEGNTVGNETGSVQGLRSYAVPNLCTYPTIK